jgi:hypothetical protein
MLKHFLTCIAVLAAAVFLAACATKTGKAVKDTMAEPAKGEVAVFGKVSLQEEIGIRMPTGGQDATLYLKDTANPVTIKVNCEDTGDFAVYIKPGVYELGRVDVSGYEFEPDIRLTVPDINKPVYVGHIDLDGMPTGVETGTGKSVFVYTVKDESKDFSRELDNKSPGSGRLLVKSIFKPGKSLATGEYPAKVMRTGDIQNDLNARTKVVEEVVTAAFVTLTNPLWLLPMDY